MNLQVKQEFIETYRKFIKMITIFTGWTPQQAEDAFSDSIIKDWMDDSGVITMTFHECEGNVCFRFSKNWFEAVDCVGFIHLFKKDREN